MEGMAVAGVLLPGDMLREILVRVDDAADLFRCATAYRPWSVEVSRGKHLLPPLSLSGSGRLHISPCPTKTLLASIAGFLKCLF